LRLRHSGETDYESRSRQESNHFGCEHGGFFLVEGYLITGTQDKQNPAKTPSFFAFFSSLLFPFVPGSPSSTGVLAVRCPSFYDWKLNRHLFNPTQAR
jgi:hypothetical protein